MHLLLKYSIVYKLFRHKVYKVFKQHTHAKLILQESYRLGVSVILALP